MDPAPARDRAAVEAALDRAAWFGHPGRRAWRCWPASTRTPACPSGCGGWPGSASVPSAGTGPRPAGWRPGGEPAGSLAASCLASHLRQVGRHAEAEPLDRLALATATAAEARADALVGLVADAVGRHELALARDRLGPATEYVVAMTSDHEEWRSRVRLAVGQRRDGAAGRRRRRGPSNLAGPRTESHRQQGHVDTR